MGEVVEENAGDREGQSGINGPGEECQFARAAQGAGQKEGQESDREMNRAIDQRHLGVKENGDLEADPDQANSG